MKPRAVFLDRDDTLMVNVPYLGDPTRVEIFPDAAEALFALRKADFMLFVVSNQSGVGRGLITQEQVHAVNAELHRQFRGDLISAFYNSFATPDDLRDRSQTVAGARPRGRSGIRPRPPRLLLPRRPPERHRVRAECGPTHHFAHPRQVEPPRESRSGRRRRAREGALYYRHADRCGELDS